MKDYLVHIQSDALGRKVPVRILLPSGNNLKCLLLLHGYGGDHNQWCTHSPIATLAEQYHLCVLLPSCNDWYYEDTVENIPGFIGEDLIHYIKSNLPVSSEKKDFSIAGVSMGGFGAMLLGSKFPELFGKIASLSGAFIIPDVVIGNQGVLGHANPEYFKKIFGSFEELEGSSRDPLAEAIRAADKHTLPEIFLLCGRQDVLCRENRNIATVLREHGATVDWSEVDGNHTWDLWNDYLPFMLKWIVDANM